MSESVDVAIIGAGPAGTSAAYEIASRGGEVVIFEEHPQVGRPPHCTGILWAPNCKRAGLEFPEALVQSEPDYVKVHFGLERSITFFASEFRIIDRPALDRHLAEKAVKAGANLRLRNHVSKISRSNGKWRLEVQTEGETKQVSSKILICADGHGTLLRQIGILPPAEIISCMQYEVRTIKHEQPPVIDAYISSELAPGGYGWVVPAGDGLAKVGMGVRNSPNPCIYYMQKLLQFGISGEPQVVERMGGIVQTSGVIRNNIADGLEVVGGAGGYVNPITGAGIVSGFWSGKLAGQAASDALRIGEFSKAAFEGFKRSSRALLDLPFDRTLALRIAYDRLGPSEFASLYRLVDKYAITKGFKKRSMIRAAITAVLRQPSLASFFWRFARARDALTL